MPPALRTRSTIGGTGVATRWRQLPDQMRDVAVVWANRIYGIGRDAQVSRFDGTQWGLVRTGNNVSRVYVGNTISDIAASSDGSVLIVNRTSGHVWCEIGDNATET